MAINVYSGLMGSGKSYEAVKSLVIPAIASGRRVVSNIDGLNQEAIHAHIESNAKRFQKLRKDQGAPLGAIVIVPNERVLEPHFFPDDDGTKDSVVQGGDFVVIDEAWRFWPSTGSKPSHEHMQFFKMHRHYADPVSGVTCDLALIIQDISGLNLDLKKVVEMTIRTTKLKSVGLNNRYRVDVYEGHKLTRSAKTSSFQNSYDKKIFPLYKSYGVEGAQEKSIDDRQNIFKGMKIWILILIAVALPAIGGRSLWGFFASDNQKELSGVDTLPAKAGASVLSNTPPKSVTSNVSDAWRIVGTATVFGDTFVVLKATQDGRLRYEPYSGFVGSGVFMNGVVDGKHVSTYSGKASEQK
ncbi:zonular occludens toxin domain-containing protein [Castellaniella ginsengisoli]|uniref:Zonular occludens toxin domain-containing protein n=1 Tax=Castellaniella ginsengisoli TaxID=546114 RepID=A0AB39GZ06_9BURK